MSWPALPRFQPADLLFSGKSLAGAMLAIFIAEAAGLPRPFWAFLTAYVVAQPLAGTVRSKGLFRFLGTLIGSTATVLLVPTFSNAPELLALALALWVGGCLYVSLLDRTLRAYVFMLAGYTAALIGFPSVETPQLIFDAASARVLEISLGLLCATLVHGIVLTTGLTPAVLGLLDRTLGDARRWFVDLMQAGPLGTTQEAADNETDRRRLATDIDADRRRLATDITQPRLLSTHVPFDTTHLHWTAGALGAMQDSVAALTPVFSAVEDRLRALREAEGRLAPDVAALLGRVNAWLSVDAQATSSAGVPAGPDTSGPRLADITAFASADAAPAHDAWTQALRVGLATRLKELVRGWQACLHLWRDVDAGLRGGSALRHERLGLRALHTDHSMALLSAVAAVVAIGVCSAFWIFTGWPSGSGAAMMAAVFCCFFATLDDPVPAIHVFLRATLWSVPLSAV